MFKKKRKREKKKFLFLINKNVFNYNATLIVAFFNAFNTIYIKTL